MLKRIQKNCLTALLLATVFFIAPALAQNNSNLPQRSANWLSTSSVRPAFVEANGQYLAHKPKISSQIVYGVENGVVAYFTRTGVIYELGKRVKMSKEEKEEFEKIKTAAGVKEDEDEEEGRTAKTIMHRSYVGMQWVGSNPDVQIIPESQVSEYWNFLDPKDANRTINFMHGYQRLTYRNLYPGIDAVYTFHPDGGVKYALIVHPGADASVVKMSYIGAEEITLDQFGVLHIAAENGEITDHAPITFYESDRSPVSSSFVLDGKSVSFSLGSYDHSRTLVIDPWTVTTFNPSFAPLEVAHDGANNAMILGQSSAQQQFVQKFDAAGVLQWSVTMSTSTSGYDGYIGDIDADPAGNSYVSKGLSLTPLGSGDAKLSPAGVLVWNNGVSPFMYENWRITFNCDYTQLLNSGCGPSCCNGGRIDLCDPITGVESGFVAPNSAGDMVCTCFGQNGYMYNVNVNNSIVCLDPAAGFATVFNLPVAYGLSDGIQLFGGAGPLGMNGIAAGCNFFYVYLGQTLEKRDLLTGALLSSVAVPGGANLMNMGVAVDKCGNVYAGSSNAIYIYDANLVPLANYPTPSFVNDIALANNGIIYATGGNPSTNSGFLAQFDVFSICNNGLTTSVTNASCSGGGGSATVTATFCSPPYTYQWSANANNQTGQTATNLPAGTYTVVVTGGGACNESDTAIVTITGSGLNVAMAQTPSNCTGNTGTATATPIGGSGPITYSWNTSPVQTSQTATNLPAGPVTVTVTDSTGCTSTQTITVGLIGGFPSTTNFAAPDCFNALTGSATATPGGGTGPFTYSWNTSPVQTTQTATGIGAGTYIVTITDSTGCSTQDTVIVTQPTQVTASITFTPPTCFGEVNGSATATGAGGGGQYSYLWVTSPVQPTATATGLGAGNYSVVVTDSAGCPTTANVTITQPPAITSALTATPPNVCLGDCSVLAANVNGGTGAYVYSWTPGPLPGNNVNVCPTTTTTYTLLITDANGCTRTDSTVVTVMLPPVAAFTADTFQGCAPLCVNFTNLTPNTQSAIWVYGDAGNFGSNANYCYPTGTFDVSLIVVGTNGCADTLTQLAYIQAFPSPTASFVAPTIQISEWESMVCFTDASSGAVLWNWNFNDPGDPTGSTVQNACHDFTSTGIYCIDLYVENANGCRDTTQECIEIIPETALYIPNAFTPNGSGPNEIFMPVGVGITNENYRFMVFDRWGMLIYESTTWGEGWDGTFKGNICQEDVYVWKLRCTDVLGKKHTMIGHVSLIR